MLHKIIKMFANEEKKRTQLKEIWVYPIKSLDGIKVNTSKILSSGALYRDREYAMFDSEGKYVHAKRTKEVHTFRASFYENINQVELISKIGKLKVEWHEMNKMEEFLSEHFGFSIHLKKEENSGFPDDRELGGPTIVSEGTLVAISNWFKETQNIDFSYEEMLRRFRPNIILGDCKEFLEDELIEVDFYLGNILIKGMEPTPRCVVPTRDPSTGEISSGFSKLLTDKRKATIGSNINRKHFEHFYKLCLNTKILYSETGKELHTGDLLLSETELWGDTFAI
ncbi:MAG: MOSC N-terminal beta barrel domain-containing protein [Leptospiraceae bacterium]|nr:MOSC N-terminal beta barrel domain-containing protein [Leptospiraceae bacterium]